MEWTSSLSTVALIQCLRRFIARQKVPGNLRQCLPYQACRQYYGECLEQHCTKRRSHVIHCVRRYFLEVQYGMCPLARRHLRDADRHCKTMYSEDNWSPGVEFWWVEVVINTRPLVHAPSGEYSLDYNVIAPSHFIAGGRELAVSVPPIPRHVRDPNYFKCMDSL